MVANTNSVEEQRLAALREVEELLQDIEQDMDGRVSRVRQNINIAEDNLLDDGEYNYCVRFALHQMSLLAPKYEAIPPERVERVDNLQAGLEEKAALPPQEQLTR
jgi:hypothetical protein